MALRPATRDPQLRLTETAPGRRSVPGADERRANGAGTLAQRRRHDRRHCATRVTLFDGGEPVGDRSNDLRSRPQTAADDDARGVVDVHEVVQAECGPFGEFAKSARCRCIPATVGLEYCLRAGRAGDVCKAASGDVSLPASVTPTRTRETATLDDHVAELTSESVRTAGHTPADNRPAADSGTDRHSEDVVVSSRRAETPFGDTRARAVVVDDDGKAEPLGQRGTQRHVADSGQMRGRHRKTLARDECGDTDTDGCDVIESTHQADDCIDGIARRVGRNAQFLDHPGLTGDVVDHDAQRLCSTDVDTEFFQQGRLFKIGVLRADEGQASQRDFNSVSVWRMRFSARRFTNPGNGMTRSIERSYVTSVPLFTDSNM